MTVSETGDLLIEAIMSKDVQKTMEFIQQFKEGMKDLQVGAEYVLWITEPPNLMRTHEALVQNLSIVPRSLAIIRRPMSRTTRAVLLLQAMEIAIKRTHSL